MSNNLLRLSILDQDVCIQTDSADYLKLLREKYRHFMVDKTKSGGQTPFYVSFFLEQNGHHARPGLMINSEEMQLEDPSLLRSEFIHGLIFSSLYSNVRSHYLHHAAALSFHNKGIILTGDSGYGKTTLTLGLVQQGFRFLSDEIAALGRKDGLLYPFPRGLHLREETLNLLDLPLSPEKASRWFGKYLIDLEDLFPGMIGGPAKISYIFVLKNANQEQPKASNSQEIKAVLSHTTSAFLQRVKQHPEIRAIQVGEEHGYPCLSIQPASRIKAIPIFEEICSQNCIMILDLIKREDPGAQFSHTAGCQGISKSQAALELLRRFVGGHKTALLSSADHPDSTSLLFELATLIGNAECYEISVGPLHETLEIITKLVCS
jgi:hypothetical protein